MPFDLVNKCRFSCCIYDLSLVPIGLELFKWGQISHFQPILKFDLKMTVDHDMWPLTSGSHVASMTQVWCKLDFIFSNQAKFHIFSLVLNLTSDDLWPWYVTLEIVQYSTYYSYLLALLCFCKVRVEYLIYNGTPHYPVLHCRSNHLHVDQCPAWVYRYSSGRVFQVSSSHALVSSLPI